MSTVGYTNIATTSTYYQYWEYTQVTENWAEHTLPLGYSFSFSASNENNARGAQLEFYILPFYFLLVWHILKVIQIISY